MNAVAFTPDGERVLSTGFDGTLREWHLASKSAGRTMTSRLGRRQYDLAITPDGRRALTVGADQRLHVWDLETGSEEVVEGHTDAVYFVEIAADGRAAATAGADGTVRVWDLERSLPEVRAFHILGAPVWCVRFHAGGRELVAACEDGTIRRLRTDDGAEIDRIDLSGAGDWAPTIAVHPLAGRPGEAFLVAGTQEGLVLRFLLRPFDD